MILIQLVRYSVINVTKGVHSMLQFISSSGKGCETTRPWDCSDLFEDQEEWSDPISFHRQ